MIASLVGHLYFFIRHDILLGHYGSFFRIWLTISTNYLALHYNLKLLYLVLSVQIITSQTFKSEQNNFVIPFYYENIYYINRNIPCVCVCLFVISEISGMGHCSTRLFSPYSHRQAYVHTLIAHRRKIFMHLIFATQATGENFLTLKSS